MHVVIQLPRRPKFIPSQGPNVLKKLTVRPSSDFVSTPAKTSAIFIRKRSWLEDIEIEEAEDDGVSASPCGRGVPHRLGGREPLDSTRDSAYLRLREWKPSCSRRWFDCARSWRVGPCDCDVWIWSRSSSLRSSSFSASLARVL